MKVCLRRAQVGAFGGHYSANREKLEGEANSLKLEMVRCWARAIMFTKRTTRTLMTLALFCVAACGTPSAPDDAALEAFIASQVQGQFEISIKQAEPFIDSETGAGRVSIAGALVAKEDLYVALSKQEVTDAFAALGVPIDHLEYIRSLLPEPMYIRRTIAQGARFPFTLEVQARKVAEGWSLSAEQGLVEVAGVSMPGSPRRTYTPDAAVMDSNSSPEVQQVLALSKEISVADEKVLASFEMKFTSGKPVTIRFWQVDKPGFAIHNNKPFSVTFTANAPIARAPASNGKGAQISVEGSVVFRGTPSDFSGRYGRATGEFYPWKSIRLVGTLTRYGKPGAIKSALNLQLYRLDDYAMAQFHRFDGSEAYFEDGRIRTYNLDSYYNWRWAE